MFTSHYEEDFLIRTLGDLIRRPEVALGELVANAWDAGAALVEVTIPEKHDEQLIVADDGCGLTKEQFDQRWMTLGYNRQKNQGSEVEFPPGRQGRRRAYGRNGQGRHGLLCFAGSYEVATRRDGKSAVFLHDPGFVVSVNGESLPMTELPGFAGEVPLEAADPETGRTVRLTLSVFEGEAGRAKHQSGVAFWVGARLVGEPGWTVMGQPIVDGRTRPGRRLTIVVKSDDLLDDVLPDWTDFRHSTLTEEVGRVVAEAVIQTLGRLYSERVRETTAEVLNDFKPAMESLGRGERAEVAEVVQSIAKADPLVAPSVLSAAVEGVIAAKKGASVQLLMRKIEALPPDDIDGLNRLLDEWTVRDALTVLDEIGRRIKVIEAMQKLMRDPGVDELHVLHPIVTQARWLFGPEYDSPQYSANLGLRNAMAKVFKLNVPASSFENPKKRPDLLVRGDSTLAAVASEDINVDTNVASCRRILLVELKKGGFRIGRKEMDQANGYIEDLLNSGHLTGSPFVHAFVVGHELDPQTTNVRKVGESPERGRVEGQTFAQLVATANARLFRIRDQVEDRYPAGPDEMMAHLREDTAAASQLGITFGPTNEA